jgi:hypothetical protein
MAVQREGFCLLDKFKLRFDLEQSPNLGKSLLAQDTNKYRISVRKQLKNIDLGISQIS